MLIPLVCIWSLWKYRERVPLLKLKLSWRSVAQESPRYKCVSGEVSTAGCVKWWMKSEYWQGRADCKSGYIVWRALSTPLSALAHAHPKWCQVCAVSRDFRYFLTAQQGTLSHLQTLRQTGGSWEESYLNKVGTLISEKIAYISPQNRLEKSIGIDSMTCYIIGLE